MEFDKQALEFLACPQCKGDLTLADKPEGLICKACKLLYPVNDGIPVMLIEKAKKTDPET